MSSEREGDMIYRDLGSTGERVSVIGLGGWNIGLKSVEEKDAIAIMRTAIDRGINFMDNSWDYNEGVSEKRMGKALKDGYRDKVLLMTKIDGRSKKEAAKQLDESLKRFNVDHIDIVQHHEVVRFEDPNRIFDPEGANAALLEAKQAGKIRYIGFTGHKDPQIHLHMLQVAKENGFRLDTVQMPLNVMDAHYRSFAELVVPELVRDNIAVLGMKSLANGIILKSKCVTPIECLHYAMNLPTSVVISGCDSMTILEQALEAVRTFEPMNKDQVAAILNKSKEFAMNGAYEPFKTSSIFDSTATHPEWLGEEPKRLQELMPQ
jgi:predicted aldo/keto reductase-like oxidoreductase